MKLKVLSAVNVWQTGVVRCVRYAGLIFLFFAANASAVKGQAVETIHGFGDGTVTNDGDQPVGNLLQAANGYLYGVTFRGGASGRGTVYQITPQGQLIILHSFGDGTVANDGLDPRGLVQGKDGNFYGTTNTGPSNLGGTVFKITPQGQLTVLHNFKDGSVTNDGEGPQSGLTLGADGNFYGTTTAGGSANGGTFFRITPSGIISILHSFGDGSVTGDGSNPQSVPVQGTDGNFYGTTYGGAFGNGNIYKMTPQGNETIIHAFTDGTVPNDGYGPQGGLIQGPDGEFYGTTEGGGPAGGYGTVFKITPQGQEAILCGFQSAISSIGSGQMPQCILALGPDGNFYGTTPTGGSQNGGTIFEVTPQGVLTNLHSFNDGTVPVDGITPNTGLTLGSDGYLYGMTQASPPGSSATGGTIYRLKLGYPAMTSPAVTNAAVNIPFNFTVTATNNTTSFVASNLPAGLSIDPAKGVITGTPTTAGSFAATITMTNSVGSNTTPLNITVGPFPPPVITSLLAAVGTVGTPFSYTVQAANYPTGFSATGLTGSGLSINTTTGIISGTPTKAGTYTVSVTASNSAGAGPAGTVSILVSASAATLSQKYALLHYYGSSGISSDGYNPMNIIQGFDGNIYGVFQYGGSANGALFSMNHQGADTLLANFSLSSLQLYNPTSVIQASDGCFYVTVSFGSNSYALVKVLPSGLIVAYFPLPGNPAGNLVQGSDGNFYGAVTEGGYKLNPGDPTGKGFIFKTTPVGVVTILHNFQDGSVANDGGRPFAGLIQATDGNFYGTTIEGGTASQGTVFKMTPQGHVNILYSFNPSGTVKNIQGDDVYDGSSPEAPLIQGSDGNFYSTTQTGGAGLGNQAGYGIGTVYRITPGGTETILHSFLDGTVANDGSFPLGGLVEGYDGNFYGTTYWNGPTGYPNSGGGTVFQITPQGQETLIHSFVDDSSLGNDGHHPQASLIQGTDGNIYGITPYYTYNFGTVFAVLTHFDPSHKPIFTGSAYGTSSVGIPFSYIPQTLFGVLSTEGAISPNFKKAMAPAESDGVIKAVTPTSWTLTGSLPDLLTFNSTTGVISGVPLVAGRFTVSITPTNSVGTGAATPVTLYIDVPPNITSAKSAAGNATSNFSYTITGDAVPTAYAATFLPAWLSVNIYTGAISGTPPNGGTFAFKVSAGNYAGNGTQQVMLTVTGGSSATPTITSATAVTVAAGTAFNYAIVATKNATSYTALILPAGLQFDPTTGIISGTPTTAGVYSIPITATNSSGTTSSELTITVVPTGTPSISGPVSVATAPNAPFNYQIPATGLVGIYNAINLPNGLSVDRLTGIISGTPVSGGQYAITMLASNGSGTGQSTLNLNVTGQQGSLQVSLSPAAATSAGARWAVDGGALQTSGATVGGLATGSHTITFSSVTGYATPNSQSASVSAGATATATATYTATASTGAVKVTLSPSAILSTGAQWAVDGGSLQSSGATVSGLAIGSHTVTFTGASGYTTPANQTVNVTGTGTVNVTGTYVLIPPTGSLMVTLNPSTAITAGALWAVDSGAAQNSGATFSGLSVGNHSVTFTDASGYVTPSGQSVTINANQTAVATATYVPVSLTPTITSPLAVLEFTGLSVSYQVTATNSPTSFFATLPKGLAIGKTTGAITGKLKGAGAYPITLTASNASGMGLPATLQLTLLATPPPTVTTSTAVNITAHTATLNATINPKGGDTMAYLQYGPTTLYGSQAPPAPVDMGAGSANVTLSRPIAGLTPGITYHYQVVGIKDGALAFGADKTFKTMTVPVIDPNLRSYLSATDIEISQSVNPGGLATTIYVRYGTTPDFSDPSAGQTKPISLAAGSALVNSFLFIPNLQPGTLYYYQVIATSAGGTVMGPVLTFTTLGFEVVQVAQKGDAAGGSTFATLGNPVLNTNQHVAFGATLTNKISGIWSADALGALQQVALVGASVPDLAGATFASLSDPVLANNNGVAFRGTIKLAKGQTGGTTGVWSTSSGMPRLVARLGSTAPGTGGGTFSALTSLGLGDVGTVIFGTLTGSKTPSITAANNMGVWEGNSTDDLQLVLRLGDVAGGKTISKMTFMPILPFVNGQTRSFAAANGEVICGATFTDKTTGIVKKTVVGTAQLVASSGAMYASFGSPAIDTNNHSAFVATLTLGGVVVKTNNLGIWADDGSGTRQLIAQSGSALAPGTSQPFLAFSDPVYNNHEAVAFRATLKAAKGQPGFGIWATDANTQSLISVAKQYDQAPGCPAGATFATFTELALADQGGPSNRGGAIFLGTLTVNAAAGVTSANCLGIWAVDSNGDLQLIVRTGDALDGKTVSGLSFLPNLAFVMGQSRNFTQERGDLSLLATFSDKSTAIFRILFP